MNYDKYVNPRLAALPPSGIRKFFDIVSEMPDAISLGVGEPDFVTPWDIRDAGIKSLQRGYTQYTSNRGLSELTENIEGYLESRFGVSYKHNSEIIVTVGASEALDLAIRSLVGEGGEVLLPVPSFVAYSPLIKMAGGKVVEIPGKKEDSFILTAADLERAITPRSKILVLPFPNNPTGAIMAKRDLEALLPIIVKHDLLVISDEIYGELTYGGRHVSVASLPGMRERTVLVSGFSKAFAMTGWRIGYVAAPKELIAPMLKLHQYAIMCAPSAAQYAAITALESGAKDDYAAVAEMRGEYDKRRRFLVKSFNDMGLACFEPKGAFYAFPNVFDKTGLDGGQFAEKLLYAQKVAVVPGESFGSCGKNFVRCCYATSMKNLAEAVNRIGKFVKTI